MLLVWVVVLALLALVSGSLGFSRLSAAAGTIARLLFFLFLFVLAVTLFWNFVLNG